MTPRYAMPWYLWAGLTALALSVIIPAIVGMIRKRRVKPSVNEVARIEQEHAEELRKLSASHTAELWRATEARWQCEEEKRDYANRCLDYRAEIARYTELFTPLQVKTISLARDLRRLLKDAGSPPELPLGPKGSSEVLDWTKKRAKWTEIILYQYQRDFSKRVDEVIYSAGIENIPIYDCNPSLGRNQIHNESDVENLINKLRLFFIQLESTKQ